MKLIKKLFDKYKPYIIGCLVLLFLVWYGLRELHLRNLAGKYAGLQVSYYEAQKDRDEYKNIGDELRKKYNELQKEKDFAIKELEIKKQQLYLLQVRHKKEIDSLLNRKVPIDTIYVRIGYLYENWDGGELKYPFSEVQIWQIYTIGVEYPRIKEEYGLQTQVLGSCFDLNKKFQLSENNLKAQIGNLSNDVLSANTQISIRTKENKMLGKQVKQKKFWNIVWKGTTLVGFGLFVAK